MCQNNFLYIARGLFVGLCCFISASASAWVLGGSSWQAGETAITVDFGTTNPVGNSPNIVSSGPTTAQFDAAYISAMNLWSTNSTFTYNVNTNGAVIDPCSGPTNGAKFATSSCSGSFGSTTLAVQTTWFSPSTSLNSNTVTVFNNSKQWDIYSGAWTGIAEFSRVAVHELGHGLGLDHSTSDAIMYAFTGDVEVPQADDLAGAAALYDTDNDGVGYASDNCPATANAGQADQDGDGKGDDCDGDIDGDGIFDMADIDVTHGLNPVGGSIFSAGPNSTNSAFPYMAQSFTANITGNLQRVDLPIYCPSGNMLLEIRTASGNQPTATILSSDTYLNGIDVPSTYSNVTQFALVTPPALISGNQYAIVLTISGECRWFTAGSYASGEGYLSTNASSWQSIGDFAFQTYTNPVPPDNCPLVQNPLQEDTNSNGVGDACELPDTDGDGIDDANDNCPALANPLQENFDGDSEGDVCDSDDDNDTLSDDDELNLYSTDPFDADSDNDNLTDGDEVNLYFTDPNDSDSDDDGFNDDVEIQLGTDPNVPNLNIPLAPSAAMVLLFALLTQIKRRQISKSS